MNRGKSGQIRVIEAFLAMIVIFSAFAVSANLAITRNATTNDDLATVGLQTLAALGSDGLLGEYANNRNWTALREAVNLVLPSSVSFNMTVYDSQMRQVNDVLISNGGLSGQDVEFVEYVCVARSSVFHSYIIHMSLAVAS
jgi:hypothetical protein